MGRSTGSADLPLHGGRVPPWLATRMAQLGRIMTEAIVLHAGRDEWLRRMAHPFWFQSFGAVMGMDWHSSGITTSVMGALKRGLSPVQDELGIYVCGGRGRHSRRTPTELHTVGDRTGLPGGELAQTSRLVAKVDSAAVQDGFELYLHSFVVARDGKWTVVQQGMNGDRRQARRYHWLSESVSDFVDEPHAAIDGEPQGTIVNLTDRRAEASRNAQVELACEGPDRVLATVRRLREDREPVASQASLPHLSLPAHHDVRGSDVVLRRLHGALRAAADQGPTDFADLLMTPGIGARTVEALAMVSEVIYGAPHRFSDPGRFSYAHGGKDGHPFPVPLTVYDETIRVLKGAVSRAKLGNEERMSAIRRLDEQARRLEGVAEGKPWQALVVQERRRSHRYGGRTVMGRAKPPKDAARDDDSQLDMFGPPQKT
ncbi:MAG: DUF763 domain-containing protein [Myxococcota bacterium]